MSFIRALSFAAAVGAGAWASLSSPDAAAAQEYPANVMEWMALPKFCWRQFNQQFTGPEYSIGGCGVGMNHYCGALLDLGRAKRVKTPYQRRGYLLTARREAEYTLSAMKKDGVAETCPIASHVQATMREIELQYKLHNIK